MLTFEHDDVQEILDFRSQQVTVLKSDFSRRTLEVDVSPSILLRLTESALQLGRVGSRGGENSDEQDDCWEKKKARL